jgi:organic hydroperoxide reductase OsmC/OhrA
MKYLATVYWKKHPSELFTDGKYHRKHDWRFDGGTEVPASSSPHVVAIPMSDESAVDPEEAFIASISSCHMLFFLSIAASHKFIVETYEDTAEGVMSKIENGEMAMTLVTLNPKVSFSGTNIPSFEQIEHLHKSAHKKCYIANSVKSGINIIQS